MPAYTFEALNPQGRTEQGVVEADSERAARSQLRTQGLVPLSVSALAASVQSAGRSRFSRRVFLFHSVLLLAVQARSASRFRSR